MNFLQDRVFPLPPNRVWRSYTGGATLDAWEGKDNPADLHFPEDWIASTTPAVNPGHSDTVSETGGTPGISHVMLDGLPVPFTTLLAADPQYFLGEAHLAKYGLRVLPLVKFLDSAVRLHIQCHPTIPFARQHFKSEFGKAEAYHILDVRPGNCRPYIYLGFQRPPSRQEMKRLVLEQDIAGLEACFDAIPVRPGDSFFVPGGLPHAIGPGVLMVEIMEPTDFVSRFEWHKSGYTLPEPARFMSRDVEFGLDMLDFTALPVAEVLRRYQPVAKDLGAGRELLVGPEQTSSFRVEKLKVSGEATLPRGAMAINIVTSGFCELETASESIQLKRGDKFFQPHGLACSNLRGQAEILRCLPPEN